MLMISEVLSQRALTENKTKFPDLIAPSSQKKTISGEKRSAQKERKFIMFTNIYFFLGLNGPVLINPAKKLQTTFNGSQVKWLQRHVCQGQGWMSEERKHCSSIAVFHIKLASSIQHLSW